MMPPGHFLLIGVVFFGGQFYRTFHKEHDSARACLAELHALGLVPRQLGDGYWEASSGDLFVRGVCLGVDGKPAK
jgi:hypothetical protein